MDLLKEHHCQDCGIFPR